MMTTRVKLSDLHWPLIFLTVTLCALGIYNLHSSAAAREPTLYLTQMLWIGVVAGAACLLLMVDYRVTEGLAYTFYGVVCLLLLAVLLQGNVAKGAQRWLSLGPVQFQPSEVAKLATVFCLARYFAGRHEPGGYTLSSLIRPLNPSRPLAVIALLILFWSRDWLADPVGQLARAVRGQLANGAPEMGDLMWFRVTLLALIVTLAGLSGWWVLRASRAQVLLNPWPEGRRRRALAAIVLGAFLATGILWWSWDADVVRDPFGWVISWLYQEAGAGGRYETLHSTVALRLALVAASGLYLLASLGAMRRPVGSSLDLLIAPIDLLAVPALLILVEPDLGTAGIVGLVGMTMILAVGVRLRSLIILGGLGIVLGVVGWFGILKDYQKRRILTFLNPEHDIQGAGWNAVQSLIAVGSGRWVGKGHQGGTQTQLSFLPEQHTDFAFSVWAEETGFLGCLFLLALYFGLLAIAIAIAADARERYGALLAIGVAGIIMWQTLINVGMVIGMFPVVGLTLPLFSYGRSSVLVVMIGIALLLNIHWRRHSH